MRLDEIIQQHTEKLPPQLQAEVFDFVLFLEQKQATQSFVATTRQQRKERLKKALDNAVELAIFAGVDGVEWQNEQRQDRNISERNE